MTVSYITWTFSGLAFPPTDPIQLAMIQTMQRMYKKALKPFEAEVKTANSKILIDFPGNLKRSKVTFANMPEALQDKITMALKKF